MSKTRRKSVPFIPPDPNRPLPPIDKTVKLPHQVRRAAKRAEDLIAGKQPPEEVTAARAKAKIPYADTRIDEVLELWDQGKLKDTDPDFGILIELAREGARLIKAHRQGARTVRKTSTKVTRRLEALIQTYRELSPKLQAHPTGKITIGRLREGMIQKLGVRDSDEVLPEDTITQDIRQVRPILRLIEWGVIPPTGKSMRRQGPSEQTRREMEAGKAALARAASAKPAPEVPDTPPVRDDF
jgi:hypothetical protein